MIYGIVLKTGQKLLTANINKVVPEDYNDPDLEISFPFEVLSGVTDSPYLIRYLNNITEQTSFSFRTEDILTFFIPNLNLSDQYLKLNDIEPQLELDIPTDFEPQVLIED
jgi:hypothetical protein